jgi:hypothetical protein
MSKNPEPSASKAYSSDDSSEDNIQPSVNEAHILQERKIGVFGAVSLIVNKIVGAGYANCPIRHFSLKITDREQDFLHTFFNF